jgi:nucleotide-binding universal stress UspA family protein
LVPRTLVCIVSDVGSGGAALEVATEVCSRLGLRLVLVSVLEGDSDPVAAAADERRARLLLVRIVAEWGLTGEVEFRVAGGKSAARLGWIVAEEAADLIVVGSTRRGWPRRGVKCELAERLACETEVPIVIALPHHRPPRPSDSLEVVGSR